MRRLACLGLVVLTALIGSAHAAPRYPIVLPKLAPEAMATREAEFRRRNPQRWTKVEVDEHGFVKHVQSDDPALMPKLTNTDIGWTWSSAEIAKVSCFLRANADLFGFDPEVADALPPSGSSLLLVEQIDNAVAGEILVTGTPVLDIRVLFWVHVTPRISERQVARRVIGQTYTDTISYGPAPALDCGMTSRGAAGCEMAVQHRIHRTVKLTADVVRSVTWLHADGNTIRLVRCIDISGLEAPEPDPRWSRGSGPRILARSHKLEPVEAAPRLPLIVDAVTGQTLSVNVRDCYQPGLSNVR